MDELLGLANDVKELLSSFVSGRERWFSDFSVVAGGEYVNAAIQPGDIEVQFDSYGIALEVGGRFVEFERAAYKSDEEYLVALRGYLQVLFSERTGE